MNTFNAPVHLIFCRYGLYCSMILRQIFHDKFLVFISITIFIINVVYVYCEKNVFQAI